MKKIKIKSHYSERVFFKAFFMGIMLYILLFGLAYTDIIFNQPREGGFYITFIFLIPFLILIIQFFYTFYSFELSEKGLLKKYPFQLKKSKIFPIETIKVVEFYNTTKNREIFEHLFFYDDKYLCKVEVSKDKLSYETLFFLKELGIPLFIREETRSHLKLLIKHSNSKYIPSIDFFVDKKEGFNYEKKYTKYQKVNYWKFIIDFK